MSVTEKIRLWVALTKPRICVMSLWMTALGYFLSSKGMAEGSWSHFAFLLLGTALVGASCGMINQALEVESDAKMRRTQKRPIVTEKISVFQAMKWGLISGLVGEIVLMFFVHPMCAIVGAVVLLFYLGIYTPSKKVTPLSTLIGAVPGALPAVMGYVAIHGELDVKAFWIFALVFIWQVPHFLAIAWLYQEDYERANFSVLPTSRVTERYSTFQALTYSVVLLPLVLLPSVLGISGEYYFWGMLGLGTLMLWGSFQLAYKPNQKSARKLFVTSIVYLPVLGFLLVWDKIA